MPITGDPSLLSLFEQSHLGVLTTIKKDGRPQLSNVTYLYDAEAGELRVSITDGRAKTRNLRRDPRASMLTSSSDGWSYAVVEGDASLSAVTTDPSDATADALVDLYRSIRGEDHPDWAEYRAAMVEQERIVLSIALTHVYGLVQSR